MKKNRVIAMMVTVLVTLILPMAVYGEDAAALYKSKCAMCHSADGSGDTTMGKSMKLRDLRSADVQKQTDKDLFAVTSDGKGKMPAYKAKMSEADINALVAHIRGLAKK